MIKWRRAGSPKMVEVPNPDGPQRAAVNMQAPSSARRLHVGRPFDAEYFGLTTRQVTKLPTDAKRSRTSCSTSRATGTPTRPSPSRNPSGPCGVRNAAMWPEACCRRHPPRRGCGRLRFRVLTSLPDVKVEGTAADPMGRTGRVISLPLETTVPLGLYTAPEQLGGSLIRQADAFWPSRDLVAKPPPEGQGHAGPLPPARRGVLIPAVRGSGVDEHPTGVTRPPRAVNRARARSAWSAETPPGTPRRAGV